MSWRLRTLVELFFLDFWIKIALMSASKGEWTYEALQTGQAVIGGSLAFIVGTFIADYITDIRRRNRK